MTMHVIGGFDIDVYVKLNGLWVNGNQEIRIVWELYHRELGNGGRGLKT